MNGWEAYFATKMLDAFVVEQGWTGKRDLAETKTISIMMLTTNVIIICVFLFYINIHGGGINPTKAFAMIAAFFMLQNPMREFTEFLIKKTEAKKSFKRINGFLLSKDGEVDPTHITYSMDWLRKKNAIEISNGDFYWVKDKY